MKRYTWDVEVSGSGRVVWVTLRNKDRWTLHCEFISRIWGWRLLPRIRKAQFRVIKQLRNKRRLQRQLGRLFDEATIR